jgi:hypothetical protein
MIRTSFVAPVLNERFILTHADLTDASTGQTFTLMTLPKGSLVKGARIKHTELFTDGAGCTCTVSVGSGVGGVALFGAAYNVVPAVADTTMQMTSGWKAGTYAADTLTATFASNVNVNTITTSGIVVIDVEILLMPDLTATGIPPGTGGGYV